MRNLNEERATTRDARVDHWLSALGTSPADHGDQPVDVEAAWARLSQRLETKRHVRWTGWSWATGLAATVLALVVAGHPSSRVTGLDSSGSTDDATGGFVSLDAGPPVQMGLVVRATVPASMLASFGVTGSGDVQADFVIGEDGRAYAFRLIR